MSGQPAASLMLGGPLGYDAAGNVIQDNLNAYAYDADGRVCATASMPVGEGSSVTQYVYDAEGNRVAKGSEHTVLVNGAYVLSCDTTKNGFLLRKAYILGPNGQQLSEVLLNPASWGHTNVWAGNQLIATDSPNGSQHTLNFEFNDWLGTRRVLTDSAGNIQQKCNSLPYGNGESCSPTPTEHLFTGKERDSESGNDYFGARYYASTMGRWLSPDPSGLLFADPGNPQSLNVYSYVRNNPLNSIDTDGLLTIIIPGTWANEAPDAWNYNMPLVGEARAHFNETHKIWIDFWDPRGDKQKYRWNAAWGLKYFIDHYNFAPGERLNIIGHSHGGNVALMAASLGLKHKIDTLITLGTPFGWASMSKDVGQWYNVTGSGDDIQPAGSNGCWTTAGCSQQNGAHNVTVNAPSHTSLWQNQGVRDLWWQWFINQQSQPQQKQVDNGCGQSIFGGCRKSAIQY